MIPARSEDDDPVSGNPGGKAAFALLLLKLLKLLVCDVDIMNISSLGMEYIPQLVGSKDPEEASSEEKVDAAFVFGAYPPQLN